ncbi:uncharacterized protein [Oscarella lobularis]|uniref:uncharacterized protein n=1 Tax=Oscarella lobularis TaxID=121494 RepID=UPI003313D0B5
MAPMWRSLFLLVSSVLATSSSLDVDTRLAIVPNRIGNPDVYFVIARRNDGRVISCQSSVKGGTSSPWDSLQALPNGTASSNPVAVAVPSTNATRIFVRSTSGLVFTAVQTTVSGAFSSWSQVGNPVPSSKASSDGVVATIAARNRITVFARSVKADGTSKLYWSVSSDGESWSDWRVVGGDKESLKTDATVERNTFVDRLEAFAVMSDGHLYHTWQTSDTSWHDWDKLWLIQPSFTSVPIVTRRGGETTFNGILEVFIRGDSDGVLYHIWQTTCDKVQNPWGPCTWGAYSKINDRQPVPADKNNPNPLTVAKNIHESNEVFSVDEKGQLWHVYQVEQGGSWKEWKKLHDQSGSSVTFSSMATIVLDSFKWWRAYGLNSSLSLVTYQQPHSFALSPSASVPSGKNVTVSWSVPEDEATNQDWIGVYPPGSDNYDYLDFVYVNGGQNPKYNPVPKGSAILSSVLPNGTYNYRYLVNKKYLDVMSGSLTVYGAKEDVEWVQLYRGLAIGLGVEAKNLSDCVKDGNDTFETFRAAFIAFEDRDVVKGLELIGQGLNDLKIALKACEETAIAEALEKFIEDLIQCTEGSCTAFLIDIVDGALSILYERFYEIYGDIRGASNAAKFGAYVQEGICIGRVTAACIEPPS